MSVFAYIAKKPSGEWSAVCAADAGPREVANFMSKYVRKGNEITSIPSREEYRAMLDRERPWGYEPKAEPVR